MLIIRLLIPDSVRKSQICNSYVCLTLYLYNQFMSMWHHYTEANMLYLESPAGVGFSYSVDQSFYASANDVVTAGDNLAFLKKWFEKYPEYKNRDFYITGESYAGHYVPQLANLIVHSKAKINLKGIAIGNPLLDFNMDLNSRGEYLWSHGLISDATYDMLEALCNCSTITRQAQSRSMTPTCSRVANC
ncbi:putative carboxypeptidase D [Helianthus debilis subsp. tardiflorus]